MKIVVTAEGQRSRDRSAAAGGISVLVKPFSLAELAGAVRQSLDSRGEAGGRS
jgi:DNA-binding response OmpR family regulator